MTVRLATVVTLLLLVIALPVAYWLTFHRKRWTFLVESVVALPLVLPPTVLGFYALIALGPLSPLGRWYQALTGQTLAFTFEGLVIGSLVYSFPFAVQPFAASFASIDPKLLAASATLGANRLRTFYSVIIPLSIPGIIAGVALTFAHTLGEFGLVLMIGGNIPGVTQTVSVLIYDRVQALEYGAANQIALILLLISFVILSIVYGTNRRIWTGWPWK